MDIKPSNVTEALLNFKEHYITALNLTEMDLANYAMIMTNNYFVGARFSTVAAEVERTDKTMFSEVLPIKRQEKQSSNNMEPSNEQPDAGPFVYRTDETMEQDKL